MCCLVKLDRLLSEFHTFSLFWRDVLKGKSEKTKSACLKNGLPKMPQLGQAWYRSRQKLSKEYLGVFSLSNCKTSVDTSHTTENEPLFV